MEVLCFKLSTISRQGPSLSLSMTDLFMRHSLLITTNNQKLTTKILNKPVGAGQFFAILQQHAVAGNKAFELAIFEYR